jgi:hypothetical protein
VEGLMGWPVTIHTSGGSRITNWTGTEAQRGFYLCEFVHLPAETYTVIPEGLDVTVKVHLRGPGVAVVRFAQRSSPQPIPTPFAPATTPPHPTPATPQATPSSAPMPMPSPTVPVEPMPAAPDPTPTELTLDCCQCTALGIDQDSPFRKPPGYTCADYCFQGCLERGYSDIVCRTGRVGGYALVCPAGL